MINQSKDLSLKDFDNNTKLTINERAEKFYEF